MLREEVLETWTSFKQKIISIIRNSGTIQVHNSYKKPQLVPRWLTASEQGLLEENKRLHYLYSLETSLKARAEENQQYEDRLRQVEEKNNLLGKKVDKMKELIAENGLEKLKSLIRRGEL